MIDPLLDRFRDEVRLYRRRGQEPLAALLESVVDELEDFIVVNENEVLTLSEAAAESGYSTSHLGRQVRDGKIPNAGRPNAPRIYREDLPRKPVANGRNSGHFDRTQIVRLAIEKE